MTKLGKNPFYRRGTFQIPHLGCDIMEVFPCVFLCLRDTARLLLLSRQALYPVVDGEVDELKDYGKTDADDADCNDVPVLDTELSHKISGTEDDEELDSVEYNGSMD